MRMLIVEDDLDLGEILQRRLRSEGHAVDWQTNGDEAEEVLAYQAYDLIIMDIGLPGKSGPDVLAAIRRKGNTTPVMMLTARTEIDERVNALDLGADDYLPKPFDFREFYARCRAMLRRVQGAAADRTTVGDLIFDRSAKIVHLGDTRLTLPMREFRLLEIFIGNLDRVLSKDQIASQLFDFDSETGTSAIELYVGRLRKKLDRGIQIQTLRGIGYVASRSVD
jgi:two-component system response regulator TctD